MPHPWTFLLLAAVPVLVIDLLILAAFVLIGIVVARIEPPESDDAVSSDLTVRRRAVYLRSSLLARVLDPWVRLTADFVPVLGLGAHARAVAAHLHAAGNPRGYRGAEYVALGLLSALLLGGVFFGLFLAAGEVAIWLPLTVAAVTYFVTYSNLKTAGHQRRVLLNRQVPYFLDLSSLTMSAGATFTQACRTIADGPVRGPLEDELALMLQEMEAGTPLAQSMENMGDRNESEELESVIRAVRQGDKLGTPLTEIFRTQAEMSRFRRSQRAEQIAGTLPNRLSIPNTIMIFASLLILFGPMIVKMIRGDAL